MSGGSVMCIVDRTIIRGIWKLRMGLIRISMWREDSNHDRWLGDMHRRSHNYSQYFESCGCGLVHRSGEKTPTMFGGSVMCIVDRTIIRSIWKLRMWALCIVDRTIIRSIWKLRMWALCILPLMLSLRRQIHLPDVYPLE
jgi:hypothetical protein